MVGLGAGKFTEGTLSVPEGDFPALNPLYHLPQKQYDSDSFIAFWPVMKKFFDEFKKFAAKGNVMDMAIGIMLGTAFNQIVQSLVNDIIMPPLGLIIGGIKFTDFKFLLKPATTDPAGKIVNDAVSINYGNFIQIFINFLIIAFSLFMAIKLLNVMKDRIEKKAKLQAEEAEEKELKPENKQVELLKDIKNLLEKNLEKSKN